MLHFEVQIATGEYTEFLSTRYFKSGKYFVFSGRCKSIKGVYTAYNVSQKPCTAAYSQDDNKVRQKSFMVRILISWMEKIKRPWQIKQAWFRIDHSNVSCKKKTNKQTTKIAYSMENINFGYSLVKRAFRLVLWLPERKNKTPAYCMVCLEF